MTTPAVAVAAADLDDRGVPPSGPAAPPLLAVSAWGGGSSATPVAPTLAEGAARCDGVGGCGGGCGGEYGNSPPPEGDGTPTGARCQWGGTSWRSTVTVIAVSTVVSVKMLAIAVLFLRQLVR